MMDKNEMTEEQRDLFDETIDMWSDITAEEAAIRGLKFYGHAEGLVSDIIQDVLSFTRSVHAVCMKNRNEKVTNQELGQLTREHWAKERQMEAGHNEQVKELYGDIHDLERRLEVVTEERDRAEAANSVKTALYRHFSEEGELLYIGISVDPFKRLHQHHIGAEWADKQMTMLTEWYPSRESALRAEKSAIIEEDPTWNVIHKIVGEAA